MVVESVRRTAGVLPPDPVVGPRHFDVACFLFFQYAFILADAAFRAEADHVLLRLFLSWAGATGAAVVFGFFCGLPRLSPPCSASMARSNLARSSNSRATMCSVGIREYRSTGPIQRSCGSVAIHWIRS